MGRIADSVALSARRGTAHRRRDRRHARARGRDPLARPPAPRCGARPRRPARHPLGDGRLASVTQALAGVELTVGGDAEAIAAGAVDRARPGPARRSRLGLRPSLLPPGARSGRRRRGCESTTPAPTRVAVATCGRAAARAGDEAALARGGRGAPRAGRRSGRWVRRPSPTWARGRGLGPRPTSGRAARGRPPPVGGARRCGLRDPSRLGRPARHRLGRPHRRGGRRARGRVGRLLAAERTLEAAAVQTQLLSVLRRHVPERVAPRPAPPRAHPGARRPPRAGPRGAAPRPFAEDDPEDLYEAAVIAYRRGDEVSARRWAATGLARRRPGRGRDGASASRTSRTTSTPRRRSCARARGLRGSWTSRRADDADRVARGGRRPRPLLPRRGARRGDRRRAPPRRGRGAGRAARRGRRGRPPGLPRLSPSSAPARPPPRARRPGPPRPLRPAVAGLLGARPVAAWATSPIDAPDQQQVVITVAKENGRVSPLVVLVDLDDLGGAVKDAFFLPGHGEPRLRRELLAPMEQVGLPGEPGLTCHEAIALVARPWSATATSGWTDPLLAHQPVLDRIERWLMRPQRGGTGRHPVTGGCSGGAALLRGRSLVIRAPARPGSRRGRRPLWRGCARPPQHAEQQRRRSGRRDHGAGPGGAGLEGERGHRHQPEAADGAHREQGRAPSRARHAPRPRRAHGQQHRRAPGPPSTSPSRPPFGVAVLAGPWRFPAASGASATARCPSSVR